MNDSSLHPKTRGHRTGVSAVRGPLGVLPRLDSNQHAGSFGARSRARTEVIDEHDLLVIMSTIRPEWRAVVALAFGCGLRFGEIIALRRSDIDLKATPPVVRVTRAVGTGQGGRRYEKGPKSTAGTRDQRIPATVLDALTEHLRSNVTGRGGLLFPAPDGGWLSETRFRKASGGWLAVRDAVGRPGAT